MTEQGVDYVVHDGLWDNGVPVLENMTVENMNGEDPEEDPEEEEPEEDPEEEEPEDEYYRGCSSPKYGDYDHCEEAS
jgi:hypothetical protein